MLVPLPLSNGGLWFDSWLALRDRCTPLYSMLLNHAFSVGDMMHAELGTATDTTHHPELTARRPRANTPNAVHLTL